MKQPAISVVMSVYNEPELWLKKSIYSILNQSFPDFEFIIINDNPQNELNQEILKEIKLSDDRIIILNNEKNIGLTRSLNMGLAIARGKYIARMDADDISLADRLRVQYDFMEQNPQCVVCGAAFRTLTGSYNNGKDFVFPCSNEEIRQLLLLDNCIPHPTAIIRNSVLQRYSIKYDEKFKYSQDYALWCLLAKYGELRNISDILLYYRISDSQISSSKRREQANYVYEIRRNYLKYIGEENDVIGEGFIQNLKKTNIQERLKREMMKSYYLTLKYPLTKILYLILVNGNLKVLFDLTYIKLLIKKVQLLDH